ncbi:NUDIX domain-containing protein [Dictyobacter arantiisoli]|uniref:NUDIX hydrolase n=1 Tax=Dictyobacter arantiisoli TaxID=2014874 RepID=A0A5A5TCF3_9CHLR|nr:NUDIX hydrolase [Dictyobacter arantiisoli]GCF09200.1 NUDIX hydrolase [Dictyobacter arantiisoli]
MKEKLKGLLAGIAVRIIALVTLGQISPILSACVIIEQDGKVLLIDRSDKLGYTIPGGIVRYKETLEECVRRETSEETGYEIQITGLVGVYSSVERDPRFRAVSIAYKGCIRGGVEHSSVEGQPCWKVPESVLGQMAFDCEHMLNDYLCGQQCLS